MASSDRRRSRVPPIQFRPDFITALVVQLVERHDTDQQHMADGRDDGEEPDDAVDGLWLGTLPST